MNVFIAKIDYFDHVRWPVLGAPYPGTNPENSRLSITQVSRDLGSDGLALLVGSRGPQTSYRLRRKLLGAVQCHRALYETTKVVHPELVTTQHFTRKDNAFRMPYCIPYSKVWKCEGKLIQAEVACGGEIVDPNRPREWFIRLSDDQADVALNVPNHKAPKPINIPRPTHGFIAEL